MRASNCTVITSFYPCFNGIRVGTTGLVADYIGQHSVSILVLMELGLEPAERHQIESLERLFLSLF